MAMTMNEAKTPSRRPTSDRRTNSTAVVPAPSAEATARKLDLPVEDTAPASLEFEGKNMKQPNRKGLLNQEAELRRQENQKAIARLVEKRDEYVERLDIGAAKIEEARSQGKDVTLWEDYWIQLLRQYEAVCDKLRDLTIPA